MIMMVAVPKKLEFLYTVHCHCTVLIGVPRENIEGPPRDFSRVSHRF